MPLEKDHTEFNLREYVSLRFETLEILIDERDKQYDARFRAAESAVTAALTAAEKQNFAASQASEKAITKAEAAQTAYNVVHNDLTRKMDSQYLVMIPRPEHESDVRNLSLKIDESKKDNQIRYDELRKEIAALRESRSEGIGNSARAASDQSRQQWITGIIFSGVGLAFGIVTFLLLNVAVK